MKTKRTLVWLLTVLVVSAPSAGAYEVESHAEISRHAAEVSGVWRALAEELGVTAGADAIVMQEMCAHAGDNRVTVNHLPKPGDWIRRAGQDITKRLDGNITGPVFKKFFNHR